MSPAPCRWSKFWRYVVRTLKFFGLFMVVTFVLSPVRNVIFMNVIPRNWLDMNSAFLVRMLFDIQNFPVDTTPIGPSPVDVPVNFADIKEKFFYKNIYPEFQAEKRRLKQRASYDAKAQNRLDILSLFDPKMDDYEHALAQFTLDTFVRACKIAGLDYFLVSGSLLGALRHHGMIPWDDDYDIAMNAAQWERSRNVLSNIEGFELFAPGDVQWKFYLKDRPKGNRPFKWPNIDIFFYSEDDTHMWSVTWGFKYGLVYLKSDVYPFFYRRFEHWNLPVPKAAHRIASLEFGPEYLSVCALASYVHKTNTRLSDSDVASISCETVYSILPFVFPHPGPTSNTVREELRLGDKSISNYTLPAEMSNL